MSTVKMREEAKARADYTDVIQRLELELAMGTERRHLDVYIRLAEQLIEQTGGNLITEALRGSLAAMKKRVAHRGFPHLVRSN